MNYRVIRLLLPIVVAFLFPLAACGGQGATPAPAATQEPAASPLPPAATSPPPPATEPPAVPTPTTVPTQPPAPEPTATSAAEPTEPLPQVVLLEEDFSDPDSGWEHYREFDGVLDYEDGGYRMWLSGPSQLFWVNAGLEAADVRIEVDATQRDGPDANRLGVVCRLDSTTWSYYALLIGSDGKYGIGKVVGNQLQLLGSAEMGTSDVIQPGAATNHLQADCMGDTLTLSVNGVQLLQVQDGTIPAGDVGLVAGTLDEPGTDVLFDDLVVYAPQ